MDAVPGPTNLESIKVLPYSVMYNVSWCRVTFLHKVPWSHWGATHFLVEISAKGVSPTICDH